MNTLEGCSPTTPYEMFSNDTTSVEVIVKQVENKKKTQSSKYDLSEINDRLCEEVEILKNDLYKANEKLAYTKKIFSYVTFELRKQLEASNQRELKRETKYLVQQLEKEKLSTLLESKTNLVLKLRKELLNVKRTIKVVMKGILYVSLSETATQSDLEYTEFESDLNTAIPKTSTNTLCEYHEVTQESTLSSSKA